MKYFFHVRAEGGLIPDDEGSDFSTLEAAVTEAIATARELAAEFPQGDSGAKLEFVSVVDEAGRSACTLPIYASF